jgi:hypothetical protein
MNATCAGEIVGKASKYFCEMIVVTCQTNMNSCPPVFSGQLLLSAFEGAVRLQLRTDT